MVEDPAPAVNVPIGLYIEAASLLSPASLGAHVHHRRLGAGSRLEPAEDLADLVLDRARGLPQPRADLGVGQPEAEQVENVELGRGERPEGARASSGGPRPGAVWGAVHACYTCAGPGTCTIRAP
jgi:hypothetical protein